MSTGYLTETCRRCIYFLKLPDAVRDDLNLFGQIIWDTAFQFTDCRLYLFPYLHQTMSWFWVNSGFAGRFSQIKLTSSQSTQNSFENELQIMTVQEHDGSSQVRLIDRTGG